MTQSKSTIKYYEQQLKKYGGFLEINKPDKALEQLMDIKKKNEKGLSVSTIKGILCALIYKLKNDKGDEKILRDYRYMLSNLRCMSEKEQRDHSKQAEDVPEWSTIIKKRDEEGKKKKYLNHLVLSLYTYIAPRRIKDFLLLNITHSKKDTEDLNNNWYLIPEKTFVFNNYKTSKKYKAQHIKAPNKLHDIIMNYVEYRGKKDGDSLLDYHNYLQIHHKLKSLLATSVDNIRHSYINYIYKGYNIPSSQMLEQAAEKMGHSVETHLRYRKF